jgi:hypothetical protein
MASIVHLTGFSRFVVSKPVLRAACRVANPALVRKCCATLRGAAIAYCAELGSPKAKSLHTMRAPSGVHLGIRPYADDCHANEFSAPMMEALAVPKEASVYEVSAVLATEERRPSGGPPLAYRLLVR